MTERRRRRVPPYIIDPTPREYFEQGVFGAVVIFAVLAVLYGVGNALVGLGLFAFMDLVLGGLYFGTRPQR